MDDVALAGDDKLVRDLAHGGEVVLGILDALERLGVVGLTVSLDQVLESLLVVIPRIPLGVLKLRSLGGFSSSLGGLAGARLLLARGLLLDIALPLAATGRGRSGDGGGRRGRLDRDTIVIVHAAHVIPEVPLAGEAVARLGALASLIGAQVRLLAMAVHGMCLALMTEQAGSRGKAGVLASLNLAAVGLQVRVDELAVGWSMLWSSERGHRKTYS